MKTKTNVLPLWKPAFSQLFLSGGCDAVLGQPYTTKSEVNLLFCSLNTPAKHRVDPKQRYTPESFGAVMRA
jgi:hypothetical protein